MKIEDRNIFKAHLFRMLIAIASMAKIKHMKVQHYEKVDVIISRPTIYYEVQTQCIFTLAEQAIECYPAQ